MQRQLHFFAKSVIATLLVWLTATTAWAAEGFVYSGFTATAGTGGTGDEGYDKLVDGNYSFNDSFTKWCTTSKSTPSGESSSCYWVDFHSDVPIYVSKYILTTGDDNEKYPGRNPKSWIIKAKLKETDSWTTIATVNNDSQMKDWNIYDFEYDLNVSGEYQFFRFMVSEIVTSANNSNILQLGELRFEGKDPSDLSYATITGLQSLYWYTGNVIDLDFTVKDADNNTLNSTDHYDYALTLGGNPVTEVKEKGVYTLTVTGKGNYNNSTSVSFKVNTELEIGTGTKTSQYLPTCYQNYSTSQQIYTAAEIGMEGTISSISFINDGTSQTRKLDVYLVHTDKSSFASDNDWIAVSAADRVYSGNVQTVYKDWTTITFDTPFAYDNNYNLAVIFVDKTNGGGGYTVVGRVFEASRQAIFSSHVTTGYDPENMFNRWGCVDDVKNQIRLEITPGNVTVCPAPTSISVGNIGTDAATITWTGNGTKWNLQYKSATDNEWTTVNNLTSKSYSLSSLSPLTSYVVRVQTVDNASSSHWKSTIFTTNTSIPFSEDFNNGSTPTGWFHYKGLLSDVLNGSSINPIHYGWDFGNSCSVFDSHAKLGISGERTNDWLVTPTMQVGNKTRLYFAMSLTDEYTNAPCETDGTDDKFVVLITTDGGTTWNILRQWDNAGSAYVYNDITNSAEGEDVLIDLSSYAGQNIAIAFYGESTVINASNKIHIDNVSITNSNLCPKPKSLIATEVGATSVTLNWTETGTATQWEICLNDDEEHLISTNSKPYILTNLTAETVYSVKVRSVNSDDQKSNWSPTININPTVKLTIGSGTSTASDMPFSNYYKYALSQQIYTTAELGSAGLIESIDLWKNNDVSCERNLDIYMVSTDKNSFSNENDWIHVTDADRVFSGTVTFADNNWTSITLDESFVYDGTQNVAIIIDDNTGSYVNNAYFLMYEVSGNQSIEYNNDGTNIDPSDPSIEGTLHEYKNQIRILKSEIGDCAKPTSLKTTELGPDFATLSWIENGTSTEWVVAYKSNTDANFTEVNATSNPFTLTSLTTYTDYTVKVRPACNENLWSSEAHFATLSPNPKPYDVATTNITPNTATISWKGFGDSYNVRYKLNNVLASEGFEDGIMPDGWRSEGASTWSVGKGDHNSSTDSHTGNFNALIKHSSNDFETYLIMPAMNLSGYSDITLHFWYINREWDGDTDELGVYYRVNGGSWNELWSTNEQHQTWTNQEISLSGLADNYEIGFKMTDHYGYGVGIDDITIEQTSTDDWTEANTTEKSITLTGLTAGKAYQYQIQSVKVGEDDSNWTDVAVFTTPGGIELADNADNNSVISNKLGETVNVTLAGRTLTKDGNWNTLCLPFSLNEEQIAASPLEGATIKELDAAASSFNNGTMTLAFTAVNEIEAGKPYIVKWASSSNISNPVFSGVTISSTMPTAVEFNVVGSSDKCKFIGQYSPFTIDANNKDEILFVGAGDKIGYSKHARTLKSCRAHFELPSATLARSININWGEGEISEIKSVIPALFEGDSAIYNLQGQRVANGKKPTAKGLYIKNGKKVVIK